MLKIDIRESDLIAKCQELISAKGSPWKEIVVQSEVLPLGDIVVYDSSVDTDHGDHILIERKTVVDLMASIRDGRYDEQSYRLIHSNEYHPHNIIYLIEGAVSKSATGACSNKGKRYQSNHASRPSGQCKLKLPVKQSTVSEADTAHSIVPEPAPLLSSTSPSNVSLSVALPSMCTAETRIFYSALFSLNHYKGFSIMRTSSLEETAIYCLYTALKMVTNNAKTCRDRAVPAYSNPASLVKPDIARDVVTDELCEEEKAEGSTERNRTEGNTEIAKYCTVVKKVKKENVTPENIGEIMLCQLPSISSTYAIAIMQYFSGSLTRCIQTIQTNSSALDSIYVTDTNGKKRKLPSSVKDTLIRYLQA